MSSEKTIEKTKLIKLLSTFSVLEWKRFGRFVQSPYHNTNSQIITLYIILKKAFPFEISKDLEQERIYKKVYGKESFKLSKFQNLCSDLYELATDFMVDVYLNKEKRKKKKVIIDALSERNYELFKGASQKLIKEVETQEYFLDGDDFLLLFQLNDKLYDHLETEKFTDKQVELGKAWINLDGFYYDTIAQMKAENVASNFILNRTIELKQDKHIQLKNLFTKMARLHESKEIEVYFQLKEQILRGWNNLKPKHKTNLLVHLINFSLANELIQKEFGYSETLSLYKMGIVDKLFIINGKMRDIEFINISMIGFKLESEEWTRNFIESNKSYLSNELSIFLIPLAYAYHAVFNNDYEQVIYLLKEINPKNNLIYLERIKKLLIRAYFDGVVRGKEDYQSPLNYEIESLKKMMIRNDKLSKLKIEANLNFLLLTKKLLNLFFDRTRKVEKILSFEALLSSTIPLTLKSWLEEKILEIKNVAS